MPVNTIDVLNRNPLNTEERIKNLILLFMMETALEEHKLELAQQFRYAIENQDVLLMSWLIPILDITEEVQGYTNSFELPIPAYTELSNNAKILILTAYQEHLNEVHPEGRKEKSMLHVYKSASIPKSSLNLGSQEQQLEGGLARNEDQSHKRCSCTIL